MGETTAISWTHSTLNAWHGCQKVSEGCKHCYAEVSTPVRVKRAGGLELWGANAGRSETKNWASNLRKWNADAATWGGVHRVFAQSLSDTFEDYDGSGVQRADGSLDMDLDALRFRVFLEIGASQALTFQLLTKRPENVLRMVPEAWRRSWPAHVWIGCTVEDQRRAEERIPHLLRVPARVRFLSVEPQLEAITIPTWAWAQPGGISWVIQGGESGPKARPFDLAWARSMKAQCAAASVPYWFKQAGSNPILSYDPAHPETGLPSGTRVRGGPPDGGLALTFSDSHGADESEYPTWLRGCRAFPAEERR